MPEKFGLILEESAKDRLTEMFTWAIKIDRLEQLIDCLQRLSSRGELTKRMRTRVMLDYAPLSLYFIMETGKHIWTEETGGGYTWNFFMNGGVIYHGPQEETLEDGSKKIRELTEYEGWSINT